MRRPGIGVAGGRGGSKHRSEGNDANRPTSQNPAQGHSPKLPEMRESTGENVKKHKDWISSPRLPGVPRTPFPHKPLRMCSS